MNYRKLYNILFVLFLVSCVKENPTAFFTVSKSSAEVNETITFTNQSENAISYSWDFGDGNTSTNENPTHLYSTGGNFTVELTAIGDRGTDSYSKIITIVHPQPVAEFSMDKSTADVDEIITFTNQSENATSYVWDFGDSNTSTNENPTHSYSTAGTFTVQLTATGKGGISSTSKTIIITHPQPVAEFSMDKSTADVGETITFTNQSENATSYAWDFGDGNTSTNENPTHSYSTAGTFTVQLTATGEGGVSSTSKTIVVAHPPIAKFSMDKSTADVDETITFTNQSENASSYAWDFGDGTTSTDENPTHSYSTAGTFTVELTAIGDGGANSTSQNVTISAPLSMTGEWTKTFIIGDDEFSGTMNIVEHSDGKLTGDFVLSDGSGYTQLLSSSNIDGTSVTIEWWLEETFKMSFRGTINLDYDYISGSFYADDIYIGSWQAYKTSTKNSVIINKNNTIHSEKDRLLEILYK